MRLLIVVALLLSLLVTVFAVQNNAATAVRFLFWSVQGSFALVLMVTLIMGILIGVLLMLPGSLRQRLRVAELNRQLRELEQRPEPPAPSADASGVGAGRDTDDG